MTATFISMLFVGLTIVHAQNVPQQSRAVADYALHEGFFRNLATIERKAQERDTSSGTGASMRNAVCTQIKLAAAECATVLATSVNVTKQIEELDKRAKVIIDAVRQQHQQRAPGEVLPSPPTELLDLQQKKQDAIEFTFQTMTNALSSAGAQAVRSFAGYPSKIVTVGK